MDSVLPAGFYCGSPSGWCVTPPPMIALSQSLIPPENNYILAFRLPVIDKMDAIRKSRSRFHLFNHCQYCTRDLIFSSLLKSDSFAIDRPQLMNVLEQALPPGTKFACKGYVEQWLGIIDVGCVATVERLPMFPYPGNLAEHAEYFFLQHNLFKIFAHILEDSCTEVLDEVRPGLVSLLEDLRQNEQSFKVIITTSQNQFRNSLTLGAPSLSPFSSSPGLGVHSPYTKAAPTSPAVAVAANNSPVWLQKMITRTKSENDLTSCNAATVGNLTGEAIFKSSTPMCPPYLSPTPYGVLSLLQTNPAMPHTHYLSPTLTPTVPDGRVAFGKRQSIKVRRNKKNREVHSKENSNLT